MRNSKPHICALIPTYNNGGTIVDVVRRVHKQMHDIIVVVDGSTDDTMTQLNALDFKITIVEHSQNRGKGKALVSGFYKAKEMGFTHALTIDGDGQHYPEDIPVLLRALDIHSEALIVGSRQFSDENMDSKSKFANRFSNFWFRLQTTINLPDTQTGMRIYPLNRLYGLKLLTSRYEAELELLVFAAWRNVPLVPVPIRVYYPPKEERVSHFVPWRDFTRISILNCFLCLGALLFGYVNMYWRNVISFGYFGFVMLFIVNPYTIFYFAIHGFNAKSRKRYHRFAQRMGRHFTEIIADLDFTITDGQRDLTGPHSLFVNHTVLPDTQSIVVSNHQSFIDIVFCLSLSPNLVMILKDYVWKNPLFFCVARGLDCFPISMDEKQREVKVKRIMEEGYSLFVFPEGTRSKTGEIGRFHRGAFYYAEKYKLPIQPILIEGMNDYVSKRQFVIKPGKATLTILPPVPYEDTSFGTTFKRRTKSFEMHYDGLLHSNRTRVAIIGAGVGGLFTGAMLAQRGYEVTVLEQLPVFGGGLYSYERNGEIWATGMHVVSGVQPEGAVTKVLEELGLQIHVVPTTLDNSPAELIGHQEWEESRGEMFRFVGGSQRLANDLAEYITRHGGRILLSRRVVNISPDRDLFVVDGDRYDAVVSSLHPKQLLKICDMQIYRPATVKRIQTTPETMGSFKIYLTLKPDSLPYDKVTHYISEQKLLVYTPCAEDGQKFARAIETVMPLAYQELARWAANRKADYASYEAYKQAKEQEVIALIEQVYPTVRECITSVFSSTSLTYRDDYLSPEGAMFGMSEAVGSVRTRQHGLYITGQNVFLHGLCGVVMTSKKTVEALCEDYE